MKLRFCHLYCTSYFAQQLAAIQMWVHIKNLDMTGNVSSRQISFTAQSNQTSGLQRMDRRFIYLFIYFLLLAILTGGRHKHLSVFYMTSWPVWNSSQGGDGAGAKWSYIAVRRCQRFNNRASLSFSHADRNADIFFVLFFFFCPHSVCFPLGCPPFLQCDHAHISIILFFFFKLILLCSCPPSVLFPSFYFCLRFLQTTHSITNHLLYFLHFPSYPSRTFLSPMPISLSSDLWGCSCLSSHPNLTTSAL